MACTQGTQVFNTYEVIVGGNYYVCTPVGNTVTFQFSIRSNQVYPLVRFIDAAVPPVADTFDILTDGLDFIVSDALDFLVWSLGGGGGGTTPFIQEGDWVDITDDSSGTPVLLKRIHYKEGFAPYFVLISMQRTMSSFVSINRNRTVPEPYTTAADRHIGLRMGGG